MNSSENVNSDLVGTINGTMYADDDISEVLKRLAKYRNKMAIEGTPLHVLLVCYTILIVTGVIGNGLVCMAVIRKPNMRTARNVYIINLAISDLFLCLFTMPFSLVEIAYKFWPLGLLTCKLISALQATSIFVSAISITAIALDRYQVIVNPTRESCKPIRTIVTLSMIWTTAIALSSPLFIFRTVDEVNVNLPMIGKLEYCIERWPIEHGRALYSVMTMVLQYVIPILIVSIAYMGILRKLKHRMKKATKSTQLDDKKEANKRRIRRTNILLFSIAIIFGISWLPLNILNIVVDLYYPFDNTDSGFINFRICFAICHMIGMSSACSNPILYGWLNDNFKKEFLEIFSICSPRLASRAAGINAEVTRHHPITESRRPSRAPINGLDSRRPSDMNLINQLNCERTEFVGEIISIGNNNSRRPSPTTLKVPNNVSNNGVNENDVITTNDVNVIQAKKFLSSSNINDDNINHVNQCFV